MKKSKKRWVLVAFPVLMMLLAMTSCTDNNDETNPEEDQTLSEQIIGKWNFTESQEMQNGVWGRTELEMPDEGTRVFTEDGVVAVSYTYQGVTTEYELKWTLNDATGELNVFNEESSSTATVSFSEDGDTLYIAYSSYWHLDNPEEVSTGEFRDVHLRDNTTK